MSPPRFRRISNFSRFQSNSRQGSRAEKSGEAPCRSRAEANSELRRFDRLVPDKMFRQPFLPVSGANFQSSIRRPSPFDESALDRA